MRWIARVTCAAVISRVHSNCRGVPACRGHHRKSLWSNRTRGSFQQPLQACQLITRNGVANSLVGWVKPLISTTGQPAAQASHDKPLDRPTKNAACRSQRARSTSGRSPVWSSTPCGMCVPHQAGAMHGLLVDAHHPIAAGFQELATTSCQPCGLFHILQPLLLCTAMHT